MEENTGEPVDASQVKWPLKRPWKAEIMKFKNNGFDLFPSTQNKANEEMACVD